MTRMEACRRLTERLLLIPTVKFITADPGTTFLVSTHDDETAVILVMDWSTLITDVMAFREYVPYDASMQDLLEVVRRLASHMADMQDKVFLDPDYRERLEAARRQLNDPDDR